MCGLTGFLGGVAGADGYEAALHRMSDTLTHRGPDDDGHWSAPGSELVSGIGVWRL